MLWLCVYVLTQVSEETTGRLFAMKRMAKSAALQCPDHVFCEQRITRNMAHPFCLRQYASFQVSVADLPHTGRMLCAPYASENMEALHGKMQSRIEL